jgi:recombinase, phage RecT family
MDAQTQITKSPMSAKELFSREDVKQKFQEMLGKRATSFITSVLQIVASNDLLAKAEPTSVYQAAAVAATLDLPLNNNLGFAYIVPYNHNYRDPDGNWHSKTVAQFQIGYKGFKQLALRSAQFLTLNATDVREGELVKHNRLTGEIEFEWIESEEERERARIIGYVSFFRLVNGFSQTFYMSVEDLTKHGKKYSQTFKKDRGLWKDDFHSMALKTVTKLNLSKNAPLSVEMQRAVTVDQSIINDSDTMDVTYVDNHEPEAIDKEAERVALLIQDAKSLEDLEKVAPHIKDEQLDLYTMKKTS